MTNKIGEKTYTYFNNKEGDLPKVKLFYVREINMKINNHQKLIWARKIEFDIEKSDIKFKMLETDNFEHNILQKYSTIVSSSKFIKIDSHVPILLGNGKDIFANLNTLEGFFDEPRVIVVLNKFMLSGNIIDLSLYEISSSKLNFDYYPIKLYNTYCKTRPLYIEKRFETTRYYEYPITKERLMSYIQLIGVGFEARFDNYRIIDCTSSVLSVEI